MGDVPVPEREFRVPTASESEHLRREMYNATLVERVLIHADLARFRIRPDGGVPKFLPGQYVALGLGYWESRLPGTQDEHLPPQKSWTLVRRAYSISCSLVDQRGALQTCAASESLEFYIALIRRADTAPAFTPRLFQMEVGERLFVQSRAVGVYTLQGVAPDDHLLMLATGTGEAPHNAMLASLLEGGHRGPIAVATCVRREEDLGYLREHRALEKQFPHYRYLCYTTREPRNLDAHRADYVGIERLQSVYASGRLAREAGFALDPKTTQVFLCGNPQMIGLQRPGEPPLDPPGMITLLTRDGFHDRREEGPGRICYEKYW